MHDKPTAPGADAPAAPAVPAAPAASAASTAEDWLRQAEAVRQRRQGGRGVGVATAGEVAGLSGLELMQAMLAGRLPAAQISRTLDFLLVEVAHGRAVFQGVPQPEHLNPMGTVHGGWYATLLDSALGCAVHTTLPAGRAYTTAELGVNLVRAAVPGREPLRAIGQVIHAGRQLATAEARLVDAAGRVYAHGTTTCLVFEARRPSAG